MRERDESVRERREQVVEITLGQSGRSAGESEQRLRELSLTLLQAEHALFDAAGDDQVVNEDRPSLTDAVRAIGSLRLGGAVPPRIVVDDRVRTDQVDARSARLQADQEHIHSAGFEGIDLFLPIGRGAGQQRVRDPVLAQSARK